MISSIKKPAGASLSRREFLKLSAAAGFGLTGFGRAADARADAVAGFSFGIVTDVHYADKAMRIQRYYRESIAKLEQCVVTFNEHRLPFAVMLGDFIDKAPDKASELEYLKTIRQIFSQYTGDRHFVLGNHDLARLSKAEYLAHCGAAVARGFYSFEAGGFHFVILDAGYRRDGAEYEAGNFKWPDTCIPPPQQEWLAQDLESARGKSVFVFVHQNLQEGSSLYGVKNAGTVRAILERAGNVSAVLQGHDHRGGYKKINGIHYFTLKALVDGTALENNAYAIVTIEPNGRTRIRGFGREQDRILV